MEKKMMKKKKQKKRKWLNVCECHGGPETQCLLSFPGCKGIHGSDGSGHVNHINRAIKPQAHHCLLYCPAVKQTLEGSLETKWGQRGVGSMRRRAERGAEEEWERTAESEGDDETENIPTGRGRRWERERIEHEEQSDLLLYSVDFVVVGGWGVWGVGGVRYFLTLKKKRGYFRWTLGRWPR